MVAANKAKKNPANPVDPANKTSPPIIKGIRAKNFNLYAKSSGNMYFLYFFPIFPRPSASITSPSLVIAFSSTTSALAMLDTEKIKQTI